MEHSFSFFMHRSNGYVTGLDKTLYGIYDCPPLQV